MFRILGFYKITWEAFPTSLEYDCMSMYIVVVSHKIKLGFQNSNGLELTMFVILFFVSIAIKFQRYWRIYVWLQIHVLTTDLTVVHRFSFVDIL